MANAPPSVLRVINASRELTASEKLLAGEYYRLDRGHEGCYAREDVMARRVALEIGTMKKYRKRLKELGIISSVPMEKDRRRQTVYFTPADRYHPSEFAKDEEVFRLAEMLDDDIRSKRPHDESVHSDAPISDESVHPDAPISLNRCTPGSESVHSSPKIGALQSNPIELELNKNRVNGFSSRTEQNVGVSQNESVHSDAPIRTESSQGDVPKKNGPTEPDPHTKPQTQSPECPHPQGSPEWKHWYITQLRTPAVS